MEDTGPLRARGRHFVPPGRARSQPKMAPGASRGERPLRHRPRRAASPASPGPRRLRQPRKGTRGDAETPATPEGYGGVCEEGEGLGGARPRSALRLRVLPVRRSFAPRCRSLSRPVAPAAAGARTGHDRPRRQRRPRGKWQDPGTARARSARHAPRETYPSRRPRPHCKATPHMAPPPKRRPRLQS